MGLKDRYVDKERNIYVGNGNAVQGIESGQRTWSRADVCTKGARDHSRSVLCGYTHSADRLFTTQDGYRIVLRTDAWKSFTTRAHSQALDSVSTTFGTISVAAEHLFSSVKLNHFSSSLILA